MTREPMRHLSSSQSSVNSKIPQHKAKSRPLAAAARAVVTRTVNRSASTHEASCGRTLVRKVPARAVPEAAPPPKDGKAKKDAVMVAVRFRPLSKKERARGDDVLWQVDPTNTVGVIVRGSFKPKFNYDTVFRDTSDNREVYNTVASNVVSTAMNGINGTIFAYGVTSSGKTHTMMGNEAQPGIVPQSICQVFEIIENTPSKAFLLRLSVMEIYNEILNDLLDPSHSNLRIREHKIKGAHIEGLREEVIISAEHALSLIARGEANRKVSCTAFNEDSSRSHIICRLSIEVSDRIPDNEERTVVARTLSYLNLIDLAGSESAKAAMSRGHRREGSYINKSLLTLGTVIHKLSDKGAIHIPFRDSKLTRLLQSSLSRNGAKVAIICTVTPASMQAEETHNTLKFASRAKKIEIKCSRNQILSDKSLIVRYQTEIRNLRKQLIDISGPGKCKADVDTSTLQEEICHLRHQLEAEVQYHAQQDVDRSALEAKVQRLTRLILTSTRALTRVPPADGLMLQRSRSVEAPATIGLEDSAFPTGTWDYSGMSQKHSDHSTSSVRSPTAIKSHHSRSESVGVPETRLRQHNRRLKDQVELMAFVLDQRERDLNDLKSQVVTRGHSADCVASSMLVDDGHNDVLQNSLEFVKQENARLTADLVKTKVELKRAQTDTRRTSEIDRGYSRPDKQLLFAPSCLSRTDSSFTDTTQVELGKVSPYPETPVSMQNSARGSEGSHFSKYETEMQDKVAKFDQRIQAALGDLTKKELQLGKIRSEMRVMQNSKDVVEKQLQELKGDNESLQANLQKQGLQNNRLQGYLLDGMSSEELNELILGLTQAAERVRLTVQLRRLSNVITTDYSVKCDLDNKETSEDSCL